LVPVWIWGLCVSLILGFIALAVFAGWADPGGCCSTRFRHCRAEKHG